TDKRIWNWVSIEGPVAGLECFNTNNAKVKCIPEANAPFPGHPGTRTAFDTMEGTYAVVANRYGSGNVSSINCNQNDCNPWGVDDEYLTIFEGRIRIRDTSSAAGTYQFRVNGDDV